VSHQRVECVSTDRREMSEGDSENKIVST